MIFLDNASTTDICTEAKSAMVFAIGSLFGNPSSLHRPGTDAKKIISDAKIQIASLLNCNEKEIYFTSGATESINTVLKGFWDAYPRAPKKIITSSAEHSATLETCKYLESKGIEVLYLRPDDCGNFRDDELIAAFSENPGLVSLMHVNNETGAITDPAHISELIRQYCPRAKFHVDAAQSFGKIKIDMSIGGIDFLSVSSHKIHGPKGTGFLYKKSNAHMIPLLHGGGQENKLRSGTENTPSIAGFGAAVKVCRETGYQETLEYIRNLRSVFLKALSVCQGPYYVNSPSDGSPYILNVSFPDTKPEVLMRVLGTSEIFVSASSACSSKSRKVSRVLKSMGFDDNRAGTAIRISFSRYNTSGEVQSAAIACAKAACPF